ncbi:hypothetical protein JOF47_002341 [Paeniglutamicibacter kerguelensis]|uniref:Uncharacterized protein n=1 Tax=Paeniglutamicibacter kerguelensis TaxID=254788 RepID=A0ABS4XEE5_9MICC|nr:hypothetical protein [Paeniglutamicibacter kerguelensis]
MRPPSVRRVRFLREAFRLRSLSAVRRTSRRSALSLRCARVIVDLAKNWPFWNPGAGVAGDYGGCPLAGYRRLGVQALTKMALALAESIPVWLMAWIMYQ